MIFDSGGRVVSFISTFSLKAFGVCSALILTFSVSRVLDVEQAGYFFVSFSVVSFLSVFCRFGFDSVVLRHSSYLYDLKDFRSIRKIFYFASLMSFFLFLVILFFYYFLGVFFEGFFRSGFYIYETVFSLLPSIFIVSVLGLISNIFIGIRRANLSVFSFSLVVNIISAVMIVFCFDTFSAKDVGFVYFLSSLLSVLIFVFIFYSYIPNSGDGGVEPIKLIGSCRSMWSASIFNQLALYSGQFLLVLWVAGEQLAQYAVAQRVAMIIGFFLVVANMFLAPRFSSLWHGKKLKELKFLASKSSFALMIACLPFAVLIYVFSGQIMLLFGEGFYDGGRVLKVMIVGYFFSVFFGAVGYLLSMTGHEKDVQLITLSTFIIGVVASVILIPLFGIIGGAFSFSLSIIIKNFLAFFLVKKRLGFYALPFLRD